MNLPCCPHHLQLQRQQIERMENNVRGAPTASHGDMPAEYPQFHNCRPLSEDELQYFPPIAFTQMKSPMVMEPARVTDFENNFMTVYETVDSPIFRKICNKCYAWPPTEQNLNACEFYDDTSVSLSLSESSITSMDHELQHEYEDDEEIPDFLVTNHVREVYAGIETTTSRPSQSFHCLTIVGIEGHTHIEDIQREFPLATRIYFDRNPGSTSSRGSSSKDGLLSATIQFSTAEEAYKSFRRSELKKIGSKTLEWLHSHEIKVENISGSVTKQDVKDLFPTAIKVKLRRASRQALLQFKTAAEAQDTFTSSLLFPLADRVLGWLDMDLLQSMPKTEINYPSGNSTATDAGATRTRAKVAAEKGSCSTAGSSHRETDSPTEKIQTTTTTVVGSRTNNNNSPDVFFWQKSQPVDKPKRTTAGSRLTRTVYVTQLPATTTIKQIKKMYPTAWAITMENWKRGKLAKIEFDSALSAAKASYISQGLRVNGFSIKVSPRKPPGHSRTRSVPQYSALVSRKDISSPKTAVSQRSAPTNNDPPVQKDEQHSKS